MEDKTLLLQMIREEAVRIENSKRKETPLLSSEEDETGKGLSRPQFTTVGKRALAFGSSSREEKASVPLSTSHQTTRRGVDFNPLEGIDIAEATVLERLENLRMKRSNVLLSSPEFDRVVSPLNSAQWSSEPLKGVLNLEGERHPSGVAGALLIWPLAAILALVVLLAFTACGRQRRRRTSIPVAHTFKSLMPSWLLSMLTGIFEDPNDLPLNIRSQASLSNRQPEEYHQQPHDIGYSIALSASTIPLWSGRNSKRVFEKFA